MFFVLFIACCLAGISQSERISKPGPVDYVILRQMWPQSSCMFPGTHKCSLAENITTWTVHGLWPSEVQSIEPNFCNDSLPFQFDYVKPFYGQMLKYWPNLYLDTKIDSFWAHEWDKHGTCALSFNPQIRNATDYFNVTLGLRDLHDLGAVLAINSIVPDDTKLYDFAKIFGAIKATFNAEPLMVCYLMKDSDVQYLSQIQICMDKQFNLIDCYTEFLEIVPIMHNNTPQETSCNQQIPIAYPTIKAGKHFTDARRSKLNNIF